MAGNFTSGGSYFYVSNSRFCGLIELAIEVGDHIALPPQKTYVERLREFHGGIWPGIGLNLEEQFSELGERKFWSTVFATLAWDYFDRSRGDQSQRGWQVAMIAQCYTLSCMLTQLVNQVEHPWEPNPQPVDDRPGPFRFKSLP